MGREELEDLEVEAVLLFMPIILILDLSTIAPSSQALQVRDKYLVNSNGWKELEDQEQPEDKEELVPLVL